MTVGELMKVLSSCNQDAEVGHSCSMLTGYVDVVVGVKRAMIDGTEVISIDGGDKCFMADNGETEFDLVSVK